MIFQTTEHGTRHVGENKWQLTWMTKLTMYCCGAQEYMREREEIPELTLQARFPL